jgi:hypothetical protein
MSGLVYNTQQAQQFVDILPDLKDEEVYFVLLSARNKYLTVEEREQYHLGRTEMFNRKLIRTKDNYTKVLSTMENDISNYKTKNGSDFPYKSLVCYANINPSSGVQALRTFTYEANNIIFDYLQNKQLGKSFKRLDTLLMNCYQKARARKYFIDIDCDVNNQIFIEPVLNDFEKHGILYHVIQTKSGYHIMIEASTVSYNFTEILAVQNSKLTVGEIIVNKNGMVPVPGTLQGQFPVNITTLR